MLVTTANRECRIHHCYHEAPQLQQERQNIAPPFLLLTRKEKGVKLYALTHSFPYFLAFFIILVFFSSGIFLLNICSQKPSPNASGVWTL
jgi:hypothetical protein